MKKHEAFILGIASISCLPSSNVTDIIDRYPSSYEKDTKKAITKSWSEVGKTLKGAMDKYGSEIKSTSK